MDNEKEYFELDTSKEIEQMDENLFIHNHYLWMFENDQLPKNKWFVLY
jgi:hypothetical protein